MPERALSLLAVAALAASSAWGSGTKVKSGPPRVPTADADRDTLTAFGLVLRPLDRDNGLPQSSAPDTASEENNRRLVVLQVLRGSHAHDMGFRSGDMLYSIDGSDTQDAAEAAARLRAWAPRSALSAVARRGLDVVILRHAPKKISLPPARAADDLTAHETMFQARQLEAARKLAPEIVRRLPTPGLLIQARQAAWARFPKGVAAAVKPGDIIEGETATPLVADAGLDFLAVPPRSAMWFEVLSSSASGGTSALKLHLFKMWLNGGHAYPCSGRVLDVTGDPILTQVSPEGTIVTAAAPSGKPPLLLHPDALVKVEFLAPVTLHEGPAFYQAGVGLWLRAKDGGYEISQLVPARAAAVAGLAVGDAVTHLQGVAVERLDFPSAVARLYGPPGSTLDLRVRRAAEPGREQSLRLVRGAAYEEGLGFRTAPQGTVLEVVEVVLDSPARRSGLEGGDRIVKIGRQDVGEIPETGLQGLFAGDLAGENAVTVRRAGSTSERTLSIRRGWVRVPLPLPRGP